LIQKWKNYHNSINSNGKFALPTYSEGIELNGSIFYLIFDSEELKIRFMEYMSLHGITVTSHYRCLHNSLFYKNRYKNEKLMNCEKISETLVRLPLFVDLTRNEQDFIIEKINEFIKNKID
jgi:dTDP-4-amino-4,6-dideoxygalactose transaminase